MDALPPWLATAVAVVILAGIAATMLGIMRVPHPWSVLAAVGRAAIQLALLSLVLAGIIQDPLGVAVGLGVMMTGGVTLRPADTTAR